MNKYLLFLFSILFSFVLQAQRFDWINTTSGENSFSSSSPAVNPISDQIANFGQHVYVVGTFRGSITLGTTTFTTNSVFESAAYLAKYDTLGNLIWAIDGGGGNSISSFITGDGLTVDDSGNVYVFGNFRSDTCKWGNLQLLKRTGSVTSFVDNEYIVKIDPNGNAVWIKGIYLRNNRSSNNIVLDIEYSSGSVYVSGVNEGQLQIYPNGLNLNSARNSIWLGKFAASNGNLLDAKTVIKNQVSLSNGIRRFTDLLVTGNDTFYISVILEDLTTYDFGTNRTRINPGITKIISKFSDTQTCDWVIGSNVQSTSALFDYQSVDMVADNFGNVYFSGTSNDSIAFQSQSLKLERNESNVFLGKINSSGVVSKLTKVEVKKARSCNIKMNASNQLFVTGYFTDTIQVGNNSTPTNGDMDFFILNADTSLAPNWFQTGGGAGREYGLSVSCNNTNSAFFLSNYNGLSQFGSSFYIGSGSAPDVIFGKVSECIPTSVPISVVGDTNLCTGDNVRLFANTSNSSLFQWMRNGVNLFGETNRDILINQSGAYQVIVNSLGCIDTSIAVNVTVGNRVNVSLAPFDTICNNDAPFQLSGGMPLGGLYSGIGVDSGLFFPSQPNLDSVRIKYTFVNNGCLDSAFSTQVLLNSPNPVISGQNNPCENTNGLNYSTSSLGPNFLWTVNGGTIVSGQNTNAITVDWGAAGTGLIRLKETNSSGCEKEVSDTIFISGQQISSTIVGEDTVCLNLTTSQYSTSFPSLFYNWSVTGGVISSGQSTDNISITWNSVGLGTIAVQVFNSCGANAIIRDTITVGNIPTVAIFGEDSICQDDYSQVYQSGNSATKYQWFSLDSLTVVAGADSAIAILGFPSSGAKSLGLIETNSFGCSDSAFKLVQVLSISRDTVFQTICEGQSYLFQGQQYNSTGIYSDTLLNQQNCDSILSLKLEVIPVFRDTTTVTQCFGYPFVFRGRAINNAGFFSDTLISQISGCDSIFILDLDFLPANLKITRDTVCEGNSYVFAGKSIDSSGVYTDTLTAANGCDSLVRLELMINSYSRRFITDTVCNGDSIIFYDTTIFASSGTYYHLIPQANGCDSLITLNLLNYIPNTFVGAFSTCDNNLPFNYRGNLINTHGPQQISVSNGNSCDSLINFFLFVYNSYNFIDSATICSGTTYNFRGRTLTSSGMYSDTLQTSDGCDSIYNLKLEVIPQLGLTIFSDSTCENVPYIFNSKSLTNQGSYYDTLTSTLGCDSIIQLNLTVLGIDSTMLFDTICSGSSILFFNQSLTTTGSYSNTLINKNGCDSVVTLQLFVLPPIIRSLNMSICQGDTFLFGNQILSQLGTYFDTLVNSVGCDSIIQLNLVVYNADSTIILDTICSGDSTVFFNQSYTTTGTYSRTLANNRGCDSTIFLQLYVSPPIIDSINISICTGSTFLFNNQILSQAGTYYDTLFTPDNCDSIIVLKLNTIDTIKTNIITSICEGDTFLLKNQKLYLTGNYSDTLISYLGCDSIVNITLNVEPLLNDSVLVKSDSLIAFQQSVSYQWLLCNPALNSFTPVVGANSRIFKPGDSSYYAVELGGNSCIDTSSCYKIQLITNLIESNTQDIVILYPNPSSGMVYLESSSNKFADANLSLYDSKGQLIEIVANYSGKYRWLDLSEQSKGVYFIKVKLSERVIYKKLILQ